MAGDHFLESWRFRPEVFGFWFEFHYIKTQKMKKVTIEIKKILKLKIIIEKYLKSLKKKQI